MRRNRIRNASWYPYAVAGCIVVILYVLLTRFSGIWDSIRTFIGYFRPVILGCVIAYIVNPLVKLFSRSLFGKIRKEKTRHFLSILLAFLVVLLFIAFSMILLIPQLIESVQTFSNNLGGYIDSLNMMLENFGLSRTRVNLESIISSSENLLDAIASYISNNVDNVLTTSANIGKGVFQWVIAFILSIYLLAAKSRLKAGLRRLLRAAFNENRYAKLRVFLHKCNEIFTRYIAYNLIDSLIIGTANAIFMSIAGMQYVGLVSLVVAVTNLVPTFGPVIGGAVGAFILLMVKPSHALIFIIFTLVLQTCDGYFIKPRLFGNSLGVPGLWILVGVIVGGNMFGVVGILLAIPVVAILDFAYGNYLLPFLREKKRQAAQRSKAPAPGGAPPEEPASGENVKEDETVPEAEADTSDELDAPEEGPDASTDEMR